MENWNQLIVEAFRNEYLSSDLIHIPVCDDNFTSLSKQYTRVTDAIRQGKIYTRISKVFSPLNDLACYELMDCVEEGDHGEDGGFGAGPDTWIIAWLNLDGSFITPFSLQDEPLYQEYSAQVMKRKYAGDFAYEFYHEKGLKTAALKSYHGNDSHVEVPETLGGCPVTRIKSGAFAEKKSLRFAHLPSGVQSIGFRAFEGCEGLESVSIPETVTTIGSFAFYRCSALKEIHLPEALKAIETGTFGYCSSLKKISFSGSLERLENAFTGCDKLEPGQIPKL